MISLTVKEWADQKKRLAKEKPVGFKVVVYNRPILYNKKKSPVTILGKFVLSEAREWVRL